MLRAGALVPLVITEGIVIIELILGLLLPKAETRPYSLICGLLIAAVILGFSIFRIFKSWWATGLAVIVSVLWLVLGFQILHDSRTHPEKYRYGDGAEAVLVLIPLGAIGVVCWSVLFFVERPGRNLSPASETVPKDQN
jgi:hypothetical protein